MRLQKWHCSEEIKKIKKLKALKFEPIKHKELRLSGYKYMQVKSEEVDKLKKLKRNKKKNWWRNIGDEETKIMKK